MKKIFSFVMGLLAMTTLQAANTEVARLTLTGQGGTESSNVILRVDPAVTTAQTTSFFGATDEVGQVNIYAIEGATKSSAYKKNDLTNLELQIITNRRAAGDQHYTLTFTVPTSTDGLRLMDRATGMETAITHNGTYEFDVNTTLHADFVAGTNYTVKGRFFINYNPAIYPASVTTGQDGWASFAFGEDLVPAIPAGLTIYKGDFNDDLANPEIALTSVANIPAGEGVFVHGAANTTYYFSNALSTLSPLADNDIVGCVSATSVSTFSGKDIYTLRYANGETALWHYTGTADIPANKAVLPINAGGPTTAPKRVRMVINQTTSVENVETIAPAEKFIEDGQVLIKRGNEVYNLQGQMVR